MNNINIKWQESQTNYNLIPILDELLVYQFFIIENNFKIERIHSKQHFVNIKWQESQTNYNLIPILDELLVYQFFIIEDNFKIHSKQHFVNIKWQESQTNDKSLHFKTIVVENASSKSVSVHVVIKCCDRALFDCRTFPLFAPFTVRNSVGLNRMKKKKAYATCVKIVIFSGRGIMQKLF